MYRYLYLQIHRLLTNIPFANTPKDSAFFLLLMLQMFNFEVLYHLLREFFDIEILRNKTANQLVTLVIVSGCWFFNTQLMKLKEVEQKYCRSGPLGFLILLMYIVTTAFSAAYVREISHFISN